jgi:membrane-anchored protein YejM (alkaline phosphatase superfamily)
MLNWSGKRYQTLERERRPRFPELLQKAGVETVGALSVTMLQPRAGIARGFGERLRGRDKAEDPADEDVADRIVERLRKQGPGALFIYTHLMEPHDPYDTHGRLAASKFDAYLIEVSVADEKVGKIRRAISELGLARRTALIIGSDHGEGFGEHRIFTHGKAFYDVLVRVPLMIEVPGVAPRTVNDFVPLMDVAPTVLDLLRVPTPGHFMAETLTPYLLGRRGNPHRLVLMESPTQRAMLFPDGLKVMERRGALELYDVLRDPDEKDDLWSELGDEGPRRLALLRAYVQTHASRRATDSELE